MTFRWGDVWFPGNETLIVLHILLILSLKREVTKALCEEPWPRKNNPGWLNINQQWLWMVTALVTGLGCVINGRQTHTQPGTDYKHIHQIGLPSEKAMGSRGHIWGCKSLLWDLGVNRNLGKRTFQPTVTVSLILRKGQRTDLQIRGLQWAWDEDCNFNQMVKSDW